MPQPTKFDLTSLNGTYAFRLIGVPAGVELGTFTADGAGNIKSTDITYAGETRQSAGNGSDYTVDPVTAEGQFLMRFHAENGKPIGPWFEFQAFNGFNDLWLVSTSSDGVYGEAHRL
jgi:hypothetical protein